MAKNKSLNAAAKAKKDEFYTDMRVIEEEMKYYRKHFRDKVVLCNCDDPFESNFFKYFAANFNKLGLKQLIATCYVDSPVAGEQISIFFDPVTNNTVELNKKPYKLVINEVTDVNGDGRVDLADVEYLIKNEKNTLTLLEGDGDFASEECIEILKRADIIATNPPFSLFRQYVALLEKYDKKYIIIGNVNAVTYKEIFPLFMSDKLWFGKSIHSGDRWFRVPDDYPLTGATTKIENGKKFVKVKGVRWFTNLDYSSRHDELDLYKKYDPETNPPYDNYAAIEVGVSKNIPRNMPVETVFGVPITFLDIYCPDQFEILGATESEGKGFSNGLWDESSGIAQPLINGKRKYKRVFIRRKE